jgi:DNA-3-methyladenine glycosylase
MERFSKQAISQKGQVLPRPFYTREDVVQISRDLLGKFLVTCIDGVLTSGMIVETEAYRASDDKACHAYNNRRTKRTEVMFAEGGKAYVYLCYGIHHLFNVVTGPQENAQAVLIRAIQAADNIPVMLERRGRNRLSPQLSAGPGVLSKALGITTSLSGHSLLSAGKSIWIEDRKVEYSPDQIIAGPRVGIDYAEECVHWPWRFRVKNSEWTSKPK